MPTFTTVDGRPVPVVTADEMAELDRVAVEEIGLGLLQMMENAGSHLAATVRELTDGPVVVYAGNGGNGGGGICAARHLSNTGVEVTVVLDRNPDDLTGAAARQLHILRATDATVTTTPASDAALAVDALVGYGLRGALRGRAAALVTAMAGGDEVVLLDVPSGVNATTGAAEGVSVVPDRTLTLALPKTGVVGLDDLWLADIGIPRDVYDRAGVTYAQPFDEYGRIRLCASA